MNRPRILIVEDEAIVARDLAQRLEALGFRVLGIARTADEAVAESALARPDLVLMDIHLSGGRDGIDAAVELRRAGGAPVVFLTGHAEERTLERAKQAEPYGFVLKPFADAELRAALEVALQRHALESRVRSSEENYRRIIETSLDGYFLTDLDGRFLEVNDAFTRICGYSREELMRLRIRDIEADESEVEVAETLRDIRDAGSARFERRHRRKDGTRIHVEVGVRWLPDEGGRIFGFLRDVTRRKELEAERELDLRLLHLGSRALSMDEFMAGATSILREGTGAELVALNLREGAGVRHFESHGDPASFTVSEGSLCPVAGFGPDPAAAPEPGSGKAACLCAAVLECPAAPSASGGRGVAVEEAPFTERGSFWTPCGLREAAVAGGRDGSCRLRDCDVEEWRSVVLVPLRVSQSVVGLLQLCDRRPDRWGRNEVAQIERLADHLAIAVGHLLAQEALKRSEERNRTLFEGLSQGVVFQGADGRITAINPAAERILGVGSLDAAGRTSEDNRWEAVNEDDEPLPGAEHPSMVALRTGHKVRDRVIGVFQPERGERVWLKVTAVPQFRPGESRPYQVFTAFEDVTEARRVEMRQRRSKALQEARLELTELAATRDLDSLLLRALDHGESLTGSGIGFFHFVDPDQRRIGLQVWSTRTLEGACRIPPQKQHYSLDEAGVWADCLRQRRVLVIEDYPTHPGRRGVPEGHAEMRRLLVVPVLRGDRVVAIMGVGNKATPYEAFDTEILEQVANFAWDLVLRKQTEEALRASESSYRGLFNTIRLALYIQDAEGRFLDVNEGAVSMYGYAREEFLGRTPEFLAAPGLNDLAALAETMRRAMSGEPQQLEFWGRRRNGEVFPKEVRLYKGTYHGQDVLIAVAADTTESRKLEERMVQMQKMEAIGQLAGGIAHDFNNLLASMMLQIGLLETSLGVDPASAEELRELAGVTERAAMLTRQLLTFSRQSPLQPRPVNLNLVVEDLTRMLRRLLGETVELVFSGEGGLPSIQADPGMVHQVVLNLCVNARDAMPAGGRLEIRTSSCVLDEAAAAANPEARPGPFVCLMVRDNGCGMDRGIQRRIFEPFFTSKGPGKGTGLGLSIVYGIVRQHRGWIDVDSEPERGTTFRVFLPVDPPPRDAAPPRVASAPAGGSETLLLVEDNDALRRSLSAYLRHLGYSVLEAVDGPSALEVWEQWGSEVDLVLTDMVMPAGMTGLELADRLRQRRPRLRIIVSSGYSAELVASGSVAHGVEFLPKPYAPAELASVVRRCLDDPQSGPAPLGEG